MDREEIVAKAIADTGIDVDQATTTCHNWIDYIQDDIASRHNWSALKKYGKIATIPIYSTGTVDVTQDSTTVSGTDTVWTESMIGRYIYLPDGNWYKIAGVVSGTEITLEIAYIGDNDTGKTYTIMAIDYSLPSAFGKMLYMRRIVPSALKIPNIPEITFVDFIANPYSEMGEINAYMFSGVDSSGNTLIRFRPMQRERRLVEISYVVELSSINSEGGTSLLPEKMHQLFVFKMKELIFDMVDLDGKAKDNKIYYEEAIAKFIKKDTEKSLDGIDVYADEEIFKGGIPVVSFDPDHYPKI